MSTSQLPVADALRLGRACTKVGRTCLDASSCGTAPGGPAQAAPGRYRRQVYCMLLASVCGRESQCHTQGVLSDIGIGCAQCSIYITYGTRCVSGAQACSDGHARARSTGHIAKDGAIAATRSSRRVGESSVIVDVGRLAAACPPCYNLQPGQ